MAPLDEQLSDVVRRRSHDRRILVFHLWPAFTQVKAEGIARAIASKGGPMKKHLLQISMIAALAVSAGNAQVTPQARANVPFGFIVDNKTLTAGEYVVGPSHDVIVIRSADNKKSILVMGKDTRSKQVQKTGKLVFHRYGNEYFLSEEWTPGDEWGHRLSKTCGCRKLHAERKVFEREKVKAQTPQWFWWQRKGYRIQGGHQRPMGLQERGNSVGTPLSVDNQVPPVFQAARRS